MKLTDLHTLLQNSILSMEPLINPYLQSPPKGTVADRVAIYANGFYSRLQEALTSDYNTLATLMGEDEFSTMCRNYMDLYPSYSYSLNFFGQNLSQFLTETSPYHKKAYLAEIAAFEWAEAQSITASEAKLLLVTDLQSMPTSQWPEMKFYLHPSCKILTMHWNSLSILEASRSCNPIPRPRKLKVPLSVLVWRHQLEMRYYKLDRLEHIMLKAIKGQASFIEICEHLCHEMPEDEVANYLVQELHAWLHEQLLVSS